MGVKMASVRACPDKSRNTCAGMGGVAAVWSCCAQESTVKVYLSSYSPLIEGEGLDCLRRILILCRHYTSISVHLLRGRHTYKRTCISSVPHVHF